MSDTPPTLIDVIASFGPVQAQPLSRIQVLTAKAMARNWTTIPHVTHLDHVDVTKLEEAREALNQAGGEKLAPTPFLVKAVANTLLRLPKFNAVLDLVKDELVLRKYVNIGLAVDTPAGLVVAVIRDCVRKTVAEIGREAATLAHKARNKGLTLSEMSGGGFTVSSLGSLGGVGFTPIINGSEVAILGVSRIFAAPTRDSSGGLTWLSMAPVSLSYDHRAINGADAGRFMKALQEEILALAKTSDAAPLTV